MEIAIGVAISAAISYASARLLAPKAGSPVKDETPPTHARRGDLLPYLIGRRLISPTICLVTNREIDESDSGGGSGPPSTGGATLTYEEDAWHVWCVGPVSRMHAIRENGTRIFKALLSPASTPSGTEVEASAGDFQPYWGEQFQPIEPDWAERLGVASRFPFLASCYWAPKYLGTRPVWGNVQYDIEVRPFGGKLTQSSSWIDEILAPSGELLDIVSFTPGDPGVASLVVEGKHNAKFPTDTPAKIVGNAIPDGFYEVLSSTYNASTKRTTIVFNEFIEGANNDGTIEPYTIEEVGGANPAHALVQMLCEPWPFGRGLPVDLFDLQSFERAAITLASEGFACCVYGDGETFEALISNLLIDIGGMLSLDPLTGKYRLDLVRSVSPSEIVTLPESSTRAPRPNVRNTVGSRLKKGLFVYEYARHGYNYKTDTVSIPGDGNSLEFAYTSKKIKMFLPVSKPVAEAVAYRRAAEDMADKQTVRIPAGREGRYLHCGQAFKIPGTDLNLSLRIASWKPAQNSITSTLGAFVDVYGVDPTTNFQDPIDDPDLPDESTSAEPSLAFGAGEVLWPINLKKMSITTPAVRSSSAVVYTDIWFSVDDGVSYTKANRIVKHARGGTLTAQLGNTLGVDFSLIEQGPTISAVGVDMDKVLDLSGDTTSWKNGKQVALFTNADGIVTEVCFLRNVTALGGDLWRLDGLIRARHATPRAAHPTGSMVYIGDYADVIVSWLCSSVTFEPGKSVKIKAQPFAGDLVNLADVAEKTVPFRGLGVIPMDPVNIRAANGVNSWAVGGPVSLEWQYRSPTLFGTGAGNQSAGAPTSAAPPEGYFELRLYTPGGVLKGTINAGTAASYSIPNATLVSVFGSEPATFLIGLRNIIGGYSSAEVQALLTRQ